MKSPAERFISLVGVFLEAAPHHGWCEALVDGLRSNATSLGHLKITELDLDTLERFYKGSLAGLLVSCNDPDALEAITTIVEFTIFTWRRQLECQARCVCAVVWSQSALGQAPATVALQGLQAVPPAQAGEIPRNLPERASCVKGGLCATCPRTQLAL